VTRLELNSYIFSPSVGNCQRMSAPIPGAPSTFNDFLSLWCRAAGDQIAGGFWSNDYPEAWVVRSSTITGYSPAFLDIECTLVNETCDNIAYTFENNIVFAVSNPNYNDDITPTSFYGEVPTVQDYNDFYGLRYCPAVNSNDRCPSPDPLFLVEPPPQVAETDFDTMNFGLSAGSPAVGTGLWLDDLTTDFTGAPRANPPSRGAFEYGSSFAAAEYLTVRLLLICLMIYFDDVLQPNPAVNPPLGQNPPPPPGPVTSLYPSLHICFPF
jgi:hypothetical protein